VQAELLGRIMELTSSQPGSKDFHPLRKGLPKAGSHGTPRVKEQLHNIMHFMGAAALLMNGGKRLNANASHFFRDIVVDVLGLVDVKHVQFQGLTVNLAT